MQKLTIRLDSILIDEIDAVIDFESEEVGIPVSRNRWIERACRRYIDAMENVATG